MINIDNRLKESLTITELLALIISRPLDIEGRKGYILVTNSALERSSRESKDMLSYCEDHNFIEVVPVGRSKEFRITDKGRDFWRGQSKQVT